MNHDVAVVGGGVVGLSVACALGLAGVRVALIEASPTPPEPGPGEEEPIDARVSAIARASEGLLTELGVWQHLPPGRRCAYESMVVWDAGSRGEVRFSAEDAGLDALGTIVENRALVRALERRVAGLDAVRWYRPARLSALDVDPRSVKLTLDRGRLRAGLVVGADGARSGVRELAGMPVRGGRFGQAAVVANFSVAGGHRGTAWQRFLPGGPLAMLPLPGAAVSMVWSVPEAEAARLTAASLPALAREVEQACDGRLSGLEAVSPARAFPLAHHHAVRYVAERIALVGDAAHAIHPLAGQGVNLGLMDAAALAQTVEELMARGRDPGRLAYLERYERWRYGHNAAVGEAMRLFHHAFTSPLAPVRWLRGAGFALTNRLAPARRAFIRLAAGLHGDLPARVEAGLRRSGGAPAL